jgi:hypothetical protein
MSKRKRTLSTGSERIRDEYLSKFKPPRTPEEWRELEWKHAAAEAAESALLNFTDNLHRDYVDSDVLRAQVTVAQRESIRLRELIIRTPAADLRSLRFKLATFDPNFDDGYEVLRTDVLRALDVMARSEVVTDWLHELGKQAIKTQAVNGEARPS